MIIATDQVASWSLLLPYKSSTQYTIRSICVLNTTNEPSYNTNDALFCTWSHQWSFANAHAFGYNKQGAFMGPSMDHHAQLAVQEVYINSTCVDTLTFQTELTPKKASAWWDWCLFGQNRRDICQIGWLRNIDPTQRHVLICLSCNSTAN